MGWKETVFGAVNGAVASAAKPNFESLCIRAGMTNVASFGDGKYVLYLNDGSFGMREVIVNWGNRLASFAIKSAAEFPVSKLFPQLGFSLLHRNKDLDLGAWDMRELSNDNYGMVVSYTALIAGLDDAVLKVICEGLVNEVAHVDGHLRAKGLI